MTLTSWLLAARPKTLPAALSPVVIGSVMAWRDGVLASMPALLAFLGAIWIQIGTNFANDYFDYIKGTDRDDRIGPMRMTQHVSPRVMKRAMVIAFALAVMCGVGLVMYAGWPVIAIGVASLLAGILYTGGPKPYGYMGLGELFVFIFFGIIAVCGTYYVQALTVTPAVMMASVGPGLLSIALLGINNLRDRETDVHTSKRTLAVMLGDPFARLEIVGSVIMAAMIPAAMGVVYRRSEMMGVAVGLAVLSYIWVVRPIRSGVTGSELNAVLAACGRLLLVYTILFSIGWGMR